MNITIIYDDHDDHYTIVSTAIMRDHRVCNADLGFMLRILSLPHDWKHNVRGWCTICGVGETSVRASISRLEKLGYIERKQERLPNGQMGPMIYILHESLLTVEDEPFPPELKAVLPD